MEQPYLVGPICLPLHSQPYPRRTIRKGLNPAICHHPSQAHECVEMDLRLNSKQIFVNNMCRFGTCASSLEWLRPDRQRRAAARKPDRLDRRGAPHGMLRSYEPGTARTGCGSRSMFPRPREACPNGLRPRWQQISSRHKLTERSSRRLCSLTITTGGCTGDARTAPYVCADLPPAANVAAARLHRLLSAEETSNATQNGHVRCGPRCWARGRLTNRPNQPKRPIN